VIQATTFHALVRASISAHADPYIVLGTVDYEDGGLNASFPYWKAVFETTQKNEEGTLKYALCQDSEDPKKLRTIEAYKDKEYLWGVHVKTDAVKENVANTKHLRTGLKHVFLKIVGGYFVK
jgi:quinol monooxygenase YgiN